MVDWKRILDAQNLTEITKQRGRKREREALAWVLNRLFGLGKKQIAELFGITVKSIVADIKKVDHAIADFMSLILEYKNKILRGWKDE